jgi:2-hydroxychromene-2-carboxylate isomerase
MEPMQFWFDPASTYSYVAAMRIAEECARAGVPLEWKPFLLGPIFTAQQGIKDSPFNVNPVRGHYMWRDLERLCEKYGLGWQRPTVFPRNSVLAARVCCAAPTGEVVRAVFRANFAEDRDIADAMVLAKIVGPEAVGRALSPGVKAQLRANTDEATRLGIFGAPNFIVGGELFFGQDRLDDAIAWHDAPSRGRHR